MSDTNRANTSRFTVNVLDLNYPLWIAPEDEELMRAAVKELNGKIAEYQERYKTLDKQMVITMAAIEYAIANKKQEKLEKLAEEELNDLLDGSDC